MLFTCCIRKEARKTGSTFNACALNTNGISVTHFFTLKKTGLIKKYYVKNV